jgi:hypothetical protein
VGFFSSGTSLYQTKRKGRARKCYKAVRQSGVFLGILSFVMTNTKQPRVTTVAETEALELRFPSSPATFDKEWRGIAGVVDLHEVTKELGYEWRAWGDPRYIEYNQTKSWDHLKTLLEMRLMLAYLQRVDYFSGYTYHECDEAVDALFQKMSQASNKPYQPLTAQTTTPVQSGHS